jgi:phosphate ABC transporter, permease protein PstA
MSIKSRSHKAASAAGYFYIYASLGIVICACLFIIITVWSYGSKVLSWSFLTTEPNPSAIHTEAGGILTPMVGTILLTLTGSLFAYPFALYTSVYLCFYSKKGWLRTLIKTAVDILAGVPTIVVGLFALAVFTYPQISFFSTPVEGTGRAYGKSFFVSGIAMAIMILPFVIKAIESALNAVPEIYMEGSLALGAPKWYSISKVVIPSARKGITTGVILGMGRIIGDTAIVWLTLGGTLRMTGLSPWFAPNNWLSTLQNTGSTLTTYIYFTSPAGEGNNYSVAFGAALVLIAIIIILNAAIALMSSRKTEAD